MSQLNTVRKPLVAESNLVSNIKMQFLLRNSDQAHRTHDTDIQQYFLPPPQVRYTPRQLVAALKNNTEIKFHFSSRVNIPVLLPKLLIRASSSSP